MDVSLPCPTTQVRAHQRQFTQKCHPSHLTHLSKPHFTSSHTTHIFIYKIGGQGVVISKQGVAITKQGWLSYHVFSSKTMHFYKTGQRVVFIKTRTETCIKGRDWTCHHQILAEGPDRSTVPRVWGRRTGPCSLHHSRDLPRSPRVLRRKQTGTQSSERTKIFYRWAWIENNLVMEIGVIFLGGFLMARLELY
jgi:hypothetical protein